MAEIPEHLLKRSRERRAALTGDSADSGSGEATPSATPATTTPSASAPVAAAAPAAPAGRGKAVAPAAPPPPKPDSPVVAAYKRRKRIPFWAMLGLVLLPVWAFMYARAVTTQAREVAGPLGVGEETYSVCASCHGGSGEGSVGYAFTGGDAVTTFPHIEDQLRFVYFGTEQYNAAGIEVYGDPDRPGGAHVTGTKGVMPSWGEGVITDEQILGVVCHERYTLGGVDPTDAAHAEEFETWCSEESEIFADLEGGGDLRTLNERFPDIIPIGDAPAPATPAGE